MSVLTSQESTASLLAKLAGSVGASELNYTSGSASGTLASGGGPTSKVSVTLNGKCFSVGYYVDDLLNTRLTGGDTTASAATPKVGFVNVDGSSSHNYGLAWYYFI